MPQNTTQRANCLHPRPITTRQKVQTAGPYVRLIAWMDDHVQRNFLRYTTKRARGSPQGSPKLPITCDKAPKRLIADKILLRVTLSWVVLVAIRADFH